MITACPPLFFNAKKTLEGSEREAPASSPGVLLPGRVRYALRFGIDSPRYAWRCGTDASSLTIYTRTPCFPALNVQPIGAWERGSLFSSPPAPTRRVDPLCLPFSAGVQFPCDSFPAFNNRRKIPRVL